MTDFANGKQADIRYSIVVPNDEEYHDVDPVAVQMSESLPGNKGPATRSEKRLARRSSGPHNPANPSITLSIPVTDGAF